MKITAEIVNGKCPTCEEFTMLVGLTPVVYRCMNCGTDLEQHINSFFESKSLNDFLEQKNKN